MRITFGRYKIKRAFRMLLPILIMSGVTAGCALHYYDRKTGTENLWGVGHLKMAVRPSDEGLSAVVKGTQTIGLGLGLGHTDYYLIAGWNDQRSITVASNASVRLEWPNADFFNVRVGADFPGGHCTTNNSEKK